MKAALQNYQARMRRVLDYIDRHLDSDLDLETVSGVSAVASNSSPLYYRTAAAVRYFAVPSWGCRYQTPSVPIESHWESVMVAA
jgi:hypothetical protein